MPCQLQHNLALNEAVIYYQETALSPNTMRSYFSGLKCFKNFAAMHNIPFWEMNLPEISEHILVYFVSFCAATLKLKYQTIKLYLCGIRHQYIKDLGFNPLVNREGAAPLQLFLTLRGVKKSTISSKMIRLPICTELMECICLILTKGVFGHYMDTLLKAASCLAFFGFLRCGEFTTRSQNFDISQNICVGDLTFTKACKSMPTHFALNLKSSKTDPFRQGYTLHFYPGKIPLCPVHSMLEYWRLRLVLRKGANTPLFLLQDGSILSREIFIQHLRIILQRLGFNPMHYSGHSFRQGAATSAAARHVPDYLIKTLGRWSSNCFETYIKTPITLIREAQSSLCHSKPGN